MFLFAVLDSKSVNTEDKNQHVGYQWYRFFHLGANSFKLVFNDYTLIIGFDYHCNCRCIPYSISYAYLNYFEKVK